MLRTQKDNPEGIEDARRITKDVLSDGGGNYVNFGEYRRHPHSQDLQQDILIAR